MVCIHFLLPSFLTFPPPPSLSLSPDAQVIEGMDLVRRIEDLPKDAKDRPLEPVVIEECGELKE